MKIAVYHNLPSGGAKRALFELVRRTSSVVDYDLYSLENDVNESFLDLRPEVKNVFRYKYKPLNHRVLGRFAAPLRLHRLNRTYQQIAKEIDAKGYDLVFVNSDFLTHTPYVLKYLKTKTVYYLQEPRRSSFEYNLSPLRDLENSSLISKLPRYLKYFLLENRLKKQDISSVRVADAVLCNSLFSYESIWRAYGIRSQVCYLGVESSADRPIPKLDRKPYVLSVGSLHPNKSHDFVIRALATIDRTHRPDFVIAHDRFLGGEKADLIALAESLQVDVDFLYRASEEQLASLYQGAIATVCAAELEPFGLTPLESIAYGTPVVAVNEGGYRETVTPSLGVLVPRSEQAMGEAISSIPGKMFSPDELRKYAREKWSWKRSTKEYLAILRKEAAKS